MRVFDRNATRQHREQAEQPTRATCLRCRREYTREPDAREDEAYCWWCAARVQRIDWRVVTE